jgi:hypothetical protein
MREVRYDRKTPNILTSDASPRVHTDSDLQFLDWYRNRFRTKKCALRFVAKRCRRADAAALKNSADGEKEKSLVLKGGAQSLKGEVFVCG